jgi:hypothetical protein
MIVTCEVFSQDTTKFEFMVRNKIIIDSLTNFYQFETNEFNVTRVNLNDSVFKEIGLFEKNLFLKKALTFKIKRDKWYVVSKKDINFYPMYENKIISLEGKKYIFENVKNAEIFNIKCLEFTLTRLKYSSSTNIKYYFNNKYGVIMISVDGVDFARNDIIERNR